RRPHLLEGLRPARRPRGLRARPAAAGGRPGRAAAARLALVVGGRARGGRVLPGRGGAGARRRDGRRAGASGRGPAPGGRPGPGVEVLAAGGTFLLARAPATDVYAQLAERRLVVRTFGHEPLLSDTLRITVMDPAANDRLLRALAAIAGGEAPSAPPGPGGRRIVRRRATRETLVTVDLALDGSGRSSIRTGPGLLDHMLTAFAFRGTLHLGLRRTG